MMALDALGRLTVSVLKLAFIISLLGLAFSYPFLVWIALTHYTFGWW